MISSIYDLKRKALAIASEFYKAYMKYFAMFPWV
jgi:hypothetical protein